MTDRRFLLHESTRRNLCRLVFAVLGAAPLTVCLGLATLAMLPGFSERQAASWSASLSQLSGLSIRVNRAHALAPFSYRLEEVQLHHPESQDWMGSIQAMTLRWEHGRWSVQATSAEMSLTHFTKCCRAVHEWYVCRPLSDRKRAIIELGELNIVNADQSARLSKIVAEVIPELEQWGLKATFFAGPHQDANSNSGSNQLILVRRHAPDQSVTELQLRASSGVPLWLMAGRLERSLALDQESMLHPLLSSGRFTGIADIRFHAQGTSVYLNDATLGQLDLGQLTWQTPGMVSGQGSLYLNHAKLESGGLKWAEGSLDIGPGRMDATFFRSLSHYLRWDVPQQNPTETLAFDRLTARFRIKPESIQCIGGLRDGTLISDSHGALARRLDESALPISHLVHALAATPGSSHLVRTALVWLPLDDVQRRETAQLFHTKNY